MVIIKFLFGLMLFQIGFVTLSADESKKFRVYSYLPAQGITEEIAAFESIKLRNAFKELGIELIDETDNEPVSTKIPSFKKLSEDTKLNGGDYFIWSSIRISGIKSFRNFYIVEANTNLTLQDFSIECSDLFCDEEEMETFKLKLKVFCKSKSIPIQEKKIDFPINDSMIKYKHSRNYNYAKLSFYLPGLGQYAFQKNTKSFLFMGSFLFSIWVGREQNYYSHQYHRQSIEMYGAAVVSNNIGLPLTVSALGLFKGASLEQDSREYDYSSKFWYFLAGSIYLFNVYDAFYISSDTRFSIQINPALPKLISSNDKNTSVFSFSLKKDFDL